MLCVYLDTMLSLTAIKQNLIHQYVAERDVYYTDAITVKIFCLKSKLFSLVIPAALKSSIKKKKIPLYIQYWI